MKFTGHYVFTPHGVQKSVFKRVPIRGEFAFASPGTGQVKTGTLTWGAKSTRATTAGQPFNPFQTTPTGRVILTTGSISTMPAGGHTINSAVVIPNPSQVYADHQFSAE